MPPGCGAGARPSAGRGYCSELQCPPRSARPIHVCLMSHRFPFSFGSESNSNTVIFHPSLLYCLHHRVFSKQYRRLYAYPPVCSKWFFESLGHDGLNKLLVGFEDKSAQAICTFAYSEGPGHEPIIFQGRTDVSCLLRHDL